MGIRNFLRRFRLMSLQAGEDQRSVDNVDAMAAADPQSQRREANVSGGAAVPPDYIKSYDEGRPKH